MHLAAQYGPHHVHDGGVSEVPTISILGDSSSGYDTRKPASAGTLTRTVTGARAAKAHPIVSPNTCSPAHWPICATSLASLASRSSGAACHHTYECKSVKASNSAVPGSKLTS